MDEALSLRPRRPRLLIEGSTPRFPSVYRGLLRRSTRVDVALTRLRIATLRLQAADLSTVRRLRIVLAELTTAAWEVETHRALLNPRREPMLRELISGIQNGTLQVRAAPLASWSPDFTVFHPDEGDSQALLGPHWLEAAPTSRGPRFGFFVSGREAMKVADRYERVWADAYDVGPAVGRLLGNTLAAIDRLTPFRDRSIVSAPQNRGNLPP
jgi:hypothetical protein